MSHPRTAYRKNMCWHMSGPRLCFVPDVWLLRGLLWLRTKEEVMRFYACVVAEKDEEVCVVTNKHCVAGISRLHGFHHYRRSALPEA